MRLFGETKKTFPERRNNLRNVVGVDVCGGGGPPYQAIQLAFQHCFELPTDCKVYHEVGRGVDHEEQVADSDEDEEPLRGLTTDCVTSRAGNEPSRSLKFHNHGEGP